MFTSPRKTRAEMIGDQTGFIKARVLPGRSTLMKVYPDGTEEIQYHDTNVVIKKPGGIIILNSGGFFTPTTKDRIREYSGIDIRQVNGIWYMPDGSSFYDGITLKEGKVINPKKPDEKRVKKIKNDIKKFTSLITENNLPLPSPGDCWMCLMFDPEGKQTDHLRSHIKEKYLHGSLLINAMRDSGYSDDNIRMHYHMKLDHTFRRAVTRYLQKRLIKNIAVR
jgi:hypothetical protein